MQRFDNQDRDPNALDDMGETDDGWDDDQILDELSEGSDKDDVLLEADDRAEQVHDFLSRVLTQMGMDVTVRRRRSDPDSSKDEIRFEIVGRDAGRVIGKKGQSLNALQYLVNRVANRPGLPRKHIVLDAEGYRHRRESSLASMARRLGAQAVKEGKIITFEPMNARDRRVVHLALARFPEVVTKSDGEGEQRRVRIIPVRR
jgi:spoIIIJ-associated protein